MDTHYLKHLVLKDPVKVGTERWVLLPRRALVTSSCWKAKAARSGVLQHGTQRHMAPERGHESTALGCSRDVPGPPIVQRNCWAVILMLEKV